MKSNLNKRLLLAIASLAAATFGCDGGSSTNTSMGCQSDYELCGDKCCIIGSCDADNVCRDSDNLRCGADHVRCDTDEVCTRGECVSISEACESPNRVCKGSCVNVKEDPRNCGKCGTKCDGYEVCQKGKCQKGCPKGYTLIDGQCYDTSLDAEHCGENNVTCGKNQLCAKDSSDDTTKCLCIVGYYDCDGDTSNGCESTTKCEYVCKNGEKSCGLDVCCPESSTCCGAECCAEGTTCCGENMCNDLQTDARHCGGCSIECKSSEICVDGVCTDNASQTCDDPELSVCWGECVNLSKDPNHCETCENACEEGFECVDSICSIICSDELTSCGRVCADLTKDNQNCGACGNSCETTSQCSTDEDGTFCILTTELDPNFTCDKLECWGQCVDSTSDSDNCGACGNKCPAGYACKDSDCVYDCPEGLSACGEECFNLSSDVMNCAECGQKCDTTQQCVSSEEGTSCKLTSEINPDFSCDSNKLECWGQCIDSSTDRNNCGACGNICPDGNECIEGACKLVVDPNTCDAPGYAFCYGQCMNLTDDIWHCGSCLNSCRSGEKCIAGKCEVQCEGLTNCNGACIDTATSANNCGECGHKCGSNQSCIGSLCQCAPGKFNCDGDDSNGCESDTDCSCTPGETQPCWRGDDMYVNRDSNGKVVSAKGACQLGTQTCDKTGQFWSACTGGKYPSSITCNEKGLPIGGDQNCDGIDDALQDCVTACDLTLTDSSYIGCEYWAAYTGNMDSEGNYAVIISNMGEEDAEVTIYRFNNKTVADSRIVKKGTVETFELSKKNKEGYMLTGTMAKAAGFRIVSTKPVTAYQFNPLRQNAVWNDALLLIPKNVYGKEYYNIIGSAGSDDWEENDTYIAILATAPGDTNFTVTPNVSTKKGSNKLNGKTLSSIPAGTPQTFKMGQFGVLQLSSTASQGMTGTKVTADRPFVAIAGCTTCYNAKIMSDDVYDHYSEQLFPYQSWGSEYAIAGFKKQGKERDQWRIFSPKDTTLTITPSISTQNHGTIGGSTKITVKANTYYDIVTKDNFHLKSTQPILIAGFLGDENTDKDPSYTLVVPVQQFRSDYSFMVPKDYDENYVSIIAPSNIGSVKIYQIDTSGNTNLKTDIGNDKFTKIGTTGYSFYRLNMKTEHQAYKLVADKPVGVQSYGYTLSSSYAYPLGLNLIKLNNTN